MLHFGRPSESKRDLVLIRKDKYNETMKKVLITGGYGFIAGYCAEELQKQGYEVHVTVRHLEKDSIMRYWNGYYLVDIRDDAGIYGAVEKMDGVIHLAGLLGTSENIRQAKNMNDVNINGALNVLNACDNFKIPMTMIAVGNWFENNTYSISKVTAERYGLMFANNFGTKVNVVRALNAIGPRQKWGKINKILPTFINKALRDEDIPVYGGKDKCGIMDMVYVGDVAKVLVESLKEAEKGNKGNVFEAGTGIGLEVWDIATRVVKECGSNSKLLEVPMRAGESERSHVVAKTPYPIKYMDFDKALAMCIDYYRKDMVSDMKN